MRVLFCYPNLYTQMGFNHGLASLSSVLKANGHETELINLNENLPPVPSYDDIYERIFAWQAGLVGFSCLTMQYSEALRIARYLRERAREEARQLPPLVVGGIHPTMVPDEVMSDGAWDHVGVGECEQALLRLVGELEEGRNPDDLANFLSWKGGVRPAQADRAPVDSKHWVKNPVGEFPELADLPFPDYGLFDTQRILDQKNGWFGLMTSRGCPYRCTYCLNHRVVDRYREDLGRSVNKLGFFRYRSPEQMVEEIGWILDRYDNVGTFILDDDLFTMNGEHAAAFAEAYRAAGFGVPWVANSHVQRLDPALARTLAEGGCRILKLGVESGSERVRREVLKRFMGDEDIFATVAAAESAGIHTSGFVMVGLPGETHEERLETVTFLARSGIGRFRTSLFFPFPGTESHRFAIEGGYVKAEDVGTLTDFTSSSCLDFGAEENLFIEKLSVCMPWFVNAEMPDADGGGRATARARYRPIVDEVLAMEPGTWESFRSEVRARDEALAREARSAGELHYAIRFNAFMGVRSDYDESDTRGIEWLTAAAKPVADARARALASAAEERC